MKTKFTVIADAARPLISNTSRADELAHAIVGALMAAGYAIVRRDAGYEPAIRGVTQRRIDKTFLGGS